MTNQHWSKLHDNYVSRGWADKPSLFAQTVLDYLPKNGTLLELGAGLGQDSMFFADQGYTVTASDLTLDRLNELSNKSIKVSSVDLRNLLPFKDSSFTIVYAHLSLHYFDDVITKQIFEEIYRILEPSGILAFFTNSVNDPQHGTGIEIERNYYEIDGTAKRFFDVESAKHYATGFEPMLADNNGETYKDTDKGVHNLIRFVGIKK